MFFDPAKAALNIKTKLSARLLPHSEADDAPASTLQYAFHGGYEPGVSSDLGLELGKPMTFQYAVVPYNGGWSEAGIYRVLWNSTVRWSSGRRNRTVGLCPSDGDS